jgi:hypothetical protein
MSLKQRRTLARPMPYARAAQAGRSFDIAPFIARKDCTKDRTKDLRVL